MSVSEKRLVQQINCYYDLYAPPGSDPGRSVPLLIALHGYEGNKESMMRLARAVNERDWLIAAPQGPYQFLAARRPEQGEPRVGFGWLTPYRAAESVALHHRNLLDLIEDVAGQFNLDRSKLFLMGFSQAVGANYRFVFSHPNLIRGVVAVCGGIPGNFQTGPYDSSATDVLHIATTADEFYPLERARTFPAALAERARAVEFLTYEGGHVFPREALPAINEWLLARVREA